MNLSGIDLNLFLVLHTVLAEGSATRAAERLHVTQSAISNSLARLRELFDDPLLVRQGRGLVPTPRAQELSPLVASAIEQLQSMVEANRGFDPAQSTRCFTLACVDGQQFSDVPRLVDAFTQRLPRAALRIVTVDYLIASNGLATGEIDVGLGPAAAVEPGMFSEALYEDGVAFVVRRDHSLVKTRLTPELFGSLLHIDVHVALGRGGVGNRAAAAAMAKHGLERKVVLTVPYFSVAALLAARTDYVAGLPRRCAEVMCSMLPLRMVESPLGRATTPMVMMWHARTHEDPGGRFFRSVISDVLRERAGSDKAPRPRKRTQSRQRRTAR